MSTEVSPVVKEVFSLASASADEASPPAPDLQIPVDPLDAENWSALHEERAGEIFSPISIQMIGEAGRMPQRHFTGIGKTNFPDIDDLDAFNVHESHLQRADQLSRDDVRRREEILSVMVKIQDIRKHVGSGEIDQANEMLLGEMEQLRAAGEQLKRGKVSMSKQEALYRAAEAPNQTLREVTRSTRRVKKIVQDFELELLQPLVEPMKEAEKKKILSRRQRKLRAKGSQDSSTSSEEEEEEEEEQEEPREVRPSDIEMIDPMQFLGAEEGDEEVRDVVTPLPGANALGSSPDLLHDEGQRGTGLDPLIVPGGVVKTRRMSRGSISRGNTLGEMDGAWKERWGYEDLTGEIPDIDYEDPLRLELLRELEQRNDKFAGDIEDSRRVTHSLLDTLADDSQLRVDTLDTLSSWFGTKTVHSSLEQRQLNAVEFGAKEEDKNIDRSLLVFKDSLVRTKLQGSKTEDLWRKAKRVMASLTKKHRAAIRDLEAKQMTIDTILDNSDQYLKDNLRRAELDAITLRAQLNTKEQSFSQEKSELERALEQASSKLRESEMAAADKAIAEAELKKIRDSLSLKDEELKMLKKRSREDKAAKEQMQRQYREMEMSTKVLLQEKEEQMMQQRLLNASSSSLVRAQEPGDEEEPVSSGGERVTEDKELDEETTPSSDFAAATPAADEAADTVTAGSTVDQGTMYTAVEIQGGRDRIWKMVDGSTGMDEELEEPETVPLPAALKTAATVVRDMGTLSRPSTAEIGTQRRFKQVKQVENEIQTDPSLLQTLIDEAVLEEEKRAKKKFSELNRQMQEDKIRLEKERLIARQASIRYEKSMGELKKQIQEKEQKVAELSELGAGSVVSGAGSVAGGGAASQAGSNVMMDSVAKNEKLQMKLMEAAQKEQQKLRTDVYEAQKQVREVTEKFNKAESELVEEKKKTLELTSKMSTFDEVSAAQISEFKASLSGTSRAAKESARMQKDAAKMQKQIASLEEKQRSEAIKYEKLHNHFRVLKDEQQKWLDSSVKMAQLEAQVKKTDKEREMLAEALKGAEKLARLITHLQHQVEIHGKDLTDFGKLYRKPVDSVIRGSQTDVGSGQVDGLLEDKKDRDQGVAVTITHATYVPRLSIQDLSQGVLVDGFVVGGSGYVGGTTVSPAKLDAALIKQAIIFRDRLVQLKETNANLMAKCRNRLGALMDMVEDLEESRSEDERARRNKRRVERENLILDLEKQLSQSQERVKKAAALASNMRDINQALEERVATQAKDLGKFLGVLKTRTAARDVDFEQEEERRKKVKEGALPSILDVELRSELEEVTAKYQEEIATKTTKWNSEKSELGKRLRTLQESLLSQRQSNLGLLHALANSQAELARLEIESKGAGLGQRFSLMSRGLAPPAVGAGPKAGDAGLGSSRSSPYVRQGFSGARTPEKQRLAVPGSRLAMSTSATRLDDEGEYIDNLAVPPTTPPKEPLLPAKLDRPEENVRARLKGLHNASMDLLRSPSSPTVEQLTDLKHPKRGKGARRTQSRMRQAQNMSNSMRILHPVSSVVVLASTGDGGDGAKNDGDGAKNDGDGAKRGLANQSAEHKRSVGAVVSLKESKSANLPGSSSIVKDIDRLGRMANRLDEQSQEIRRTAQLYEQHVNKRNTLLDILRKEDTTTAPLPANIEKEVKMSASQSLLGPGQIMRSAWIRNENTEEDSKENKFVPSRQTGASPVKAPASTLKVQAAGSGRTLTNSIVERVARSRDHAELMEKRSQLHAAPGMNVETRARPGARPPRSPASALRPALSPAPAPRASILPAIRTSSPIGQFRVITPPVRMVTPPRGRNAPSGSKVKPHDESGKARSKFGSIYGSPRSKFDDRSRRRRKPR